MRKSIKNIEKEMCTGCKMCEDVCIMSAISFKKDEEGFWFPIVDERRCTNCGSCLNKCPVREKLFEEKQPIHVYAAWNRNDKVRRESTSGGIYHAISSYILSQQGILVGCRYENDYKSAFHTIENDEAGLRRLMESKYFQSDTTHIYYKVQKMLESGKVVFFSGTPCQVAALKSYIGEVPENLYTMDFICRGVSSPSLQKKRIELYEEKEKSRVKYYKDKYKKYAWIDFGAKICFENGKEKFVSRWVDDTLHCFTMKNLSMRESCYNCQFKLGNMKSDITVGDFWGIEGVTEKDLRDGVSVLLVNTLKGDKLISNIRKNLYLMKKPIDKVYKANPSLTTPPERPKERKDFYRIVNEKGLNEALKKYRKFRAETKKEVKRHQKKMIQRPLLFLKEDWKQIDIRKFIRYNFFCRSIIRNKNAYLIPYKGAVIDISPTSKLYLKGNVLINYYPAYKRGKQTALLQLRNNSEARIHNRVELAYGATLSVADNAKFSTGYLTTMINTQIICKHKMKFGNNIMLGRDICIFDSDYHPIYNECYESISADKEVIIDDNVWIGTKCMILKGSHIEEGTIIGADTLVSGKVPKDVIYTNSRNSKVLSEGVIWNR